SGVASWVWVRPIFTMLAKAWTFSFSARDSSLSAGIRLEVIAIAAAICIAVGNESFDDWLMLTWSLGCTGFLAPSSPPNSWLARLAMTSLRFMLLWVPEPVCHTTSGK